MNFFALILKNYDMSFEDETASYSFHSSMTIPYILTFKPELKFLLFINVSTLTFLTTVDLIV